MAGEGRIYPVVFTAVTVTAQQDLFYLKPAADLPIKLRSVVVAMVGGTADAGDAQEELLQIDIKRLPATVTVGSGGSSFTPNKKFAGDSAASFTARINDTTKATTSGTAVTVWSDGMNNRNPFFWKQAEGEEVWGFNATAIVVELNTTVNDSALLSGTALVEEFG